MFVSLFNESMGCHNFYHLLREFTDQSYCTGWNIPTIKFNPWAPLSCKDNCMFVEKLPVENKTAVCLKMDQQPCGRCSIKPQLQKGLCGSDSMVICLLFIRCSPIKLLAQSLIRVMHILHTCHLNNNSASEPVAMSVIKSWWFEPLSSKNKQTYNILKHCIEIKLKENLQSHTHTSTRKSSESAAYRHINKKVLQTKSFVPWLCINM